MSDRPEKLLSTLKDVYDAFHGIARSTWHEQGLARPAALVMRHIDKHPGITVSGLARMTGLAKSNVSKSVESLIEHGFVDKRSDPADQRLRHLYATEKAQAHFSKMWEQTRARLSAMVGCLADGQIDDIVVALQTLKDVIDREVAKNK